jgi:hypothetical protein
VQAFGSGIALLAVATLIADVLVEYVLPHRHRYKASKVKEVDDLTDDEAVSDRLLRDSVNSAQLD